jgi:hypothetical protein
MDSYLEWPPTCISVTDFSCVELQIDLFILLLFSEETVAKEKIWSLISQNEPSVVPISLVAIHSLSDNSDI